MTTLSGLVVDIPHINNILSGEKIWEMRTSHTHKRGLIALIRKGSGLVVGAIEVTGSIGPLDREKIRANSSKHMIPLQMLDDASVGKWNHAWSLRGVRALSRPIPYVHPPGAVIWVTLDETTSDLVLRAVGLPAMRKQSTAFVTAPPVMKARQPAINVAGTPRARATSRNPLDVPYAADGTYFHAALKRRGNYTVGNKDCERKFAEFEMALRHLRDMPVAKWRRPNPSGNWGIVSAVRWGERRLIPPPVIRRDLILRDRSDLCRVAQHLGDRGSYDRSVDHGARPRDSAASRRPSRLYANVPSQQTQAPNARCVTGAAAGTAPQAAGSPQRT
jgi:hypothetical protein